MPSYQLAAVYSVLIALHQVGEGPKEMLTRCSALALRRGYLLAVPEWSGGSTVYHYSAEEHAAVANVLRDLRRCGYLREDDTVLCSRAMLLPYANIIFDLDRADVLKTVHGYLDEIGIAYCGRYGDWGYLWTHESFKSGELAAQRALEVPKAPRGVKVPQPC